MTGRFDGKRIVTAAVTTWLVSIPIGAFIHHDMFEAIYAANAAAYRPDPEIVRRLIGLLAVAYVFARLHPERRGIVDGLRFGALMGVVLVGLAAVWSYVTLPISPAAGVAAAIEYVARRYCTARSSAQLSADLASPRPSIELRRWRFLSRLCSEA